MTRVRHAVLGGLLAVTLVSALLGLRQLPSSDAPLGTPQGCSRYNGLPAGWPANPLAGMQPIKGGTYRPGSEQGYPDEVVLGTADVADFMIDRTEVSQAQFAAFVAATGYVTEAERTGGGAVFQVPTQAQLSEQSMPWWRFVAGASWRQPGGPDQAKPVSGNQPVALVTLEDAQAYAHWLGNELPTEAEWEYAARGGRDGEPGALAPVDGQGKPTANYWQGIFPFDNAATDGYPGVAPVGCFSPNGYGLFDMIGNLWEWTSDVYTGALQNHANGDPARLGFRPILGVPRQVIKGGSFLCASNYCMRYRVAARQRQEANLATGHVGFRTIRRLEKD